MKRERIRIYSAIACLLTAILLPTSCTSETDGVAPDGGGRAIRFNPGTATRAAVTSAGDMQAFTVWGGYTTDAESAGIPTNVFDGVEVENAGGGWSYDGTRYWTSGKTYQFFAAYPAGTGKLTDGAYIIENFDCSAIGAEAKDLMTASSDMIDTGNAVPASVPLTFNHLLTRIRIVGTVEGGNAVINSIGLEKVITVGSYASGKWTNSTSTKSIVKDTTINLTAVGQDLVDDMFLLPQATDDINLYVVYTLDGGEKITKRIPLHTDKVPQWTAANSYKYSLAIRGNNIVFAADVEPWSHSMGGIITVE